jgi:hypothetical protein
MTGIGTAADPYLVSNKAELKQAMEIDRSTGLPIYIRLTANINVNWNSTWPVITTAGHDSVDVDLNGHTIKNMYLKDIMFTLHNSDRIHNGRIINVYTDSSFDKDYIISSGVLENVSMNCSITVPTATVFNCTRLIKDAIWLHYDSATPKSGQAVFKAIILKATTSATDINQIEDCDIKIMIDTFDAAGGTLISAPASGSCYIATSRITGEITTFNNASATYYPIISDVTMRSSVVEYIIPSYSGSGSPTPAHNLATGDADYVSAINVDIGIVPHDSNLNPIYSLGNGCAACTSNDLRSQYLLYQKRFEVYQIQGS